MLLMPTYTFKGEKAKQISPKMKDCFITEYTERYAEFAATVNEHLAEWNEDFDFFYPDKNGWSEEYAKFIAYHYKPVLERVNAGNHMFNMVELCVDINDDCNIYGYIDWLDCCIYMALDPRTFRKE